MNERARHAAKVSLAMVIAYGLALTWGWINPQWAGIAVAFCALTTRGESLNKSLHRLVGTVVGVTAAFTFLALFPQDRWWFMVLVSGYIAVVSYLMAGSVRPYIWHVAGFVCLIITLTGPTDPGNVFIVGMARGYETALGCVVWALVGLLIWPETNGSALAGAKQKIDETQRRAVALCSDFTRGQPTGVQLTEARGELMQLGTQLHALLAAAGAERAEVREVRPWWVQFESASRAFLTDIDRWHLCIDDVEGIDLASVVPGLDDALASLESAMPSEASLSIDVSLDSRQATELTAFERAAAHALTQRINAVGHRMETLAAISQGLVGKNTAATPPSQGLAQGLGSVQFPLPDPDRLRGAVFVWSTMWVGFLLWIFVDPPGHASLYMMPPTIGMAVAMAPHTMMARGLLKPFIVYLPVAIALYLLVMPRLESYADLAVLMFLYIFWVQYSLRQPLANLAGTLGFVVLITIENQQTYSFVAIATSYLFMLISVLIVVGCSYLLMSPRPEKMFLRLLRRYLRSAAFLVSRAAAPGATLSGFDRYRTRFHSQQLAVLPDKLAAWGGQIDHAAHPGNDKGDVDRLVSSLKGLTYRVQDFLQMRTNALEMGLAGLFNEQTAAWRNGIGSLLAEVSTHLNSAPEDREHIRSPDLDNLLSEETFEQTDAQGTVYDLLAACRGIAAGLTDYTTATRDVDWASWREERF